MVPAGATAHKQTSSEVRVPFPVEAGGSTRRPGEFASGRGVSLWRGDRPTFGGVLEVRRIVRDCAYWTDNLLRLGPSERERERETLKSSPILSLEKSRFHPGRILRGRPGSGEAPFCGLANLWTAFSNLTPQTILQWEFFLGLGDEKKEKIPAHTNSCSRLLKLPAEAVYHKYRKKRTSKTNISSYLSRSCTTVIDDRFSNTGHTGSPASVAPLTSRPWTPHPEIPEGVPRAN